MAAKYRVYLLCDGEKRRLIATYTNEAAAMGRAQRTADTYRMDVTRKGRDFVVTDGTPVVVED